MLCGEYGHSTGAGDGETAQCHPLLLGQPAEGYQGLVVMNAELEALPNSLLIGKVGEALLILTL